jgi:hypothetical protein
MCAETCNEGVGDCSTPDPNGSDCGTGNICIAATCSDVRLVFVTSTLYDGDDLGSAAAADTECGARATAASLPGTFMAWVSDASTSPSARFTPAAVNYVLLDATKVADDYADLSSGNVDSAIDVDEFGVAVVSSLVWTGTQSDGTAATDHCSSWMSALMGDSATAGSTGFQNGSWSDAGTETCDNSYRLYCVEQ